MPGPLENARHELFAVLIAKGEIDSASGCYLKAGYNCTQRTAEVNASDLLRKTEVIARIDELKTLFVQQVAQQSAITTVDVVNWLSAIATFDPRALFKRAKVKGKVMTIFKDVLELDATTARCIRSIKQGPHGLEYTFEPRVPAQRLIGEHLGMFQGESAGSIPTQPGTTINNDNRTVVYIDAPRSETMEEWQRRVDRQQRLPIEHKKVNGGANGAG